MTFKERDGRKANGAIPLRLRPDKVAFGAAGRRCLTNVGASCWVPILPGAVAA